MRRYYFNIRSSTGLIRDPDGSELPDLAAARSEAEDAARELLTELLKQGGVPDGQVFEIADADGHVLDHLPLRNVLGLP